MTRSNSFLANNLFLNMSFNKKVGPKECMLVSLTVSARPKAYTREKTK